MRAVSTVCAAAVTLFSSALLTAAAGPAAAGEVIAAVAANFTGAMHALAAAFREETDHAARPSFASTGTLFAQIAHGAPFEVFLSADLKTPERAEADGLAVAGTRFTYATGHLVLWSAEPTLFEDGAAYLEDASYAHLAVTNPKTAPYGAAALEVLERLGILDEVEAKIVQGDNVSQTLQFIATGNAEAGFIAEAQVIGWAGPEGTVWKVPQTLYQPIEQAAVLLKPGETSEAARAFLVFLQSDTAREIMARHGYGVPAERTDVAAVPDER